MPGGGGRGRARPGGPVSRDRGLCRWAGARAAGARWAVAPMGAQIELDSQELGLCFGSRARRLSWRRLSGAAAGCGEEWGAGGGARGYH